MGDCGAVLAFSLRPLSVDVYPLMVESGVGKKVYALLVDEQPVGSAEVFAEMSCEIVVRIDY